MGVDNGEIVGDVMLGLFVAKKIADRHETQKAARAEGITFEEMRLREQAARYRAKASRPYMMFQERKQKKWAARANACDEQLARFEETRRKAAATQPSGNQTNNENQATNYHQNTQCFCRQCGAAKVEGAVFCGKYGTKITSTKQQPYVPEANIIVNGSSTTNPNYQPVEYKY